MKFRLVEHINEEELQAQLQEDYEHEQSILDQVRDILTAEDFKETKELNGISFSKDLSRDDFTSNAQFYVDTTTFEYSAYITTDDETNSTSYSAKGDIENIIPAVERFITQL